MEKIIITPEKVRGMGNIVDVKTVGDFTSSNTSLSEGESEVVGAFNRQVFIMEYQNDKLYFTEVVTRSFLTNANNTFKGIVKDDNGRVVTGASVKLYVDNTLTATATSNNQGIVSFPGIVFSTSGEHNLYLDYNNVLSQILTITAYTVDHVSVTASDTEMWQGETITFNATVYDSNNEVIPNVQIGYNVTDPVEQTVLVEDTIYTGSDGSASVNFAQQYIDGGSIIFEAEAGAESATATVYERLKYYYNEFLTDKNQEPVLENFIPSFSSGDIVLPTAADGQLYWGRALPSKFNISFTYKGESSFNGLIAGLRLTDGLISYKNSKFTVCEDTFSGSLSSGDIFTFHYNGTSLKISQIRNNATIWTRTKVMNVSNATFGFTLSSAGYKVNNVIADYYNRPEATTTMTLALSATNINEGSSVTLTGTSNVPYGIIKFYEGNTLLSTQVANNNGVATYTYTPVNTGSLTMKATCNDIENTKTLNVLTPGSLTCSSNKSVVIKNNAITLSSTVKATTGVVLSGVTVDFYNGSTKLGSATTNSSGVATYSYTPTSAGTLSITAKTGNITSSAVSVRVKNNNNPSVITISADKTSAILNESITITGIVKDAEGDVCANILMDMSVDGGSNYATALFLTESDGTFSANYAFPTAQTLRFRYRANGTSVQSNTVTVTVVNSYNGVSVTSDKSILSYYDSDTCTLSAQLLNGSSAVSVSGVSVEFFAGSTSLGTAQTNSSGIATKTYTSAGVGDVNITAKVGTFVSETCSLEDCILYDPLTSASGKWTIPSGVTSQYSDNGWRISASSYKQIKLTEKLTNACSVEFTLIDYNKVSSGGSLLIYQYTNGETTPNQEIMNSGNSSSRPTVLGTQVSHDLIKGAVYKIEYNTTLKVYEDDTLLGSATNNVGFPTRFEWHMGANSRYAIYKDLKVKPL